MIEMCRLKNVIFIQTFLIFVLSRKIINSHYHDHYQYHCKMHLCCLNILVTVPLCNMIPCLFQLNFVFFLPVYIFLWSYSKLFVFYSSKRTQNSFATIRHILDFLFILTFISTVIYAETVVHRYSSKQVFLKISQI